MIKIQFDLADGEEWFEMPAVPRVGDEVEFADSSTVTVQRVVWTPWDNVGQHVTVVAR